MRFGFVTCVQLGLACMEEIYLAGGSLDLVLTLPDERATLKSGRIYPDEFCTEHGIPLLKVDNINSDESLATLSHAHLDWLFIIGWSQIARRPVLETPRKGTIGMHPTLLPKGRGRAAIPWAILKGLDRTGVTMFQLDEGVDSGPILGQHEILIDPRETAQSLYEKVEQTHRSLIRRVWPELEADTVRPEPQDDSLATTWEGRRPADGLIKRAMTVREVDRLVRATTRPYPGAFFLREDSYVIVWAGHPAAEGSVSGKNGEERVELTCSDGIYIATETEERSLDAAPTSVRALARG